MPNSTFGPWFKRLLEGRELTPADVARLIDKDPSRVSEWINGKRVPNPESCDLLSDKLGIDLDVLLFRAGHRPVMPALDPDDPKMPILGLINKIDWNDPVALRQATRVLTHILEGQALEKEIGQ